MVSAVTQPVIRTADLYTFQARALYAAQYSAWSEPVLISAAIIPLAPVLSWDAATYTLTITHDDGNDPGVVTFIMTPSGSGYVARTGLVTVLDLNAYAVQIDTAQSGYTHANVQAVRNAGWYIGDMATIQLAP